MSPRVRAGAWGSGMAMLLLLAVMMLMATVARGAELPGKTESAGGELWPLYALGALVVVLSRPVLRWVAWHQRLAEFHRLVNELREPEGNEVSFICDNPEFDGQPNYNIDVVADFTGWKPKRYGSDCSLLDCLRAARRDMALSATVGNPFDACLILGPTEIHPNHFSPRTILAVRREWLDEVKPVRGMPAEFTRPKTRIPRGALVKFNVGFFKG